jgi:hypothetical protein
MNTLKLTNHINILMNRPTLGGFHLNEQQDIWLPVDHDSLRDTCYHPLGVQLQHIYQTMSKCHDNL